MKNIKFLHVLEIIACIAVIILMGGFFSHGKLHATSNFPQGVISTFYCAGQVVNQHKDPYLTEPLRSCENEYNKARKYPWVEPAPLPGYALAGFGLLARLPFEVAKTIWFYFLIATVVSTAILLSRLVKVPVLLTLLCFSMAAYFNLMLGEPPFVAVLALVAASVLGANKKYLLAVICASVAMIQPTLALPACLAMFIWWPLTRVSFIISGTILAAISVVTIGLPVNIEYFLNMLPLQALSEITASDQYSLTRVMHIWGFSDTISIVAGKISYAFMVVFGVFIVRSIATKIKSEALIVLFPSAIAMLGGIFVHDIEMAIVIPAALIFATSNVLNLWLRIFTLVALTIPIHDWHFTNLDRQLWILEIGIIVASVLIATSTKRIKIRSIAIYISTCILVCLMTAYVIEKIPPYNIGPKTTVAALAIAPNDLSSANWAASVTRDKSYSTPTSRDIGEKLPIWLGLITLVFMGIYITVLSIITRSVKPRLERNERFAFNGSNYH